MSTTTTTTSPSNSTGSRPSNSPDRDANANLGVATQNRLEPLHVPTAEPAAASSAPTTSANMESKAKRSGSTSSTRKEPPTKRRKTGDVLDADSGDVASVGDEKTTMLSEDNAVEEMVKKVDGRWRCQVEGCDKSYTLKGNWKMHWLAAHCGRRCSPAPRWRRSPSSRPPRAGRAG